jgi:hypothetical protein
MCFSLQSRAPLKGVIAVPLSVEVEQLRGRFLVCVRPCGVAVRRSLSVLLCFDLEVLLIW